MTEKNINKIIVVDDEVVIALGLQERLTAMGYEVIDIAHTGEEAVEKARSLQPDLMLLDIMIPEKLDGITVAEIVKAELDIPVIFITAFSEDQIIDRAKKAEPYGYIIKPFQDRELKAAIEVALYKKEMEQRLCEAEVHLQKAHDELERRVEERTKDLEIKSTRLEEVNVAMKVLLEHSEMYKKELEEKVLSNIKELVDPYLEKLEGSGSDAKKIYLSIIKSNIDEIISPFTQKLSSKYLNLTPSEIRIANLVKQGKTTKEMAGILNISGTTVGFHRENIRKKLGLKNKKANLRSHLLSLL